MADKCGSVSGIEVTQNPTILVVTAGKRRAGMNSAGDIHDGAVQRGAKPGHGIGLIGVGLGQKLGTHVTEDGLRGRENALVLFPTSGHVEQTKQYAGRAYPDAVVEVAGAAFARKGSREIRVSDHRESGSDRLDDHWDFPIATKQQAPHKRPRKG